MIGNAGKLWKNVRKCRESGKILGNIRKCKKTDVLKSKEAQDENKTHLVN